MADHPDINDPDRFVYYRYAPSLAAAAIFVTLFGISTSLHTYQLWLKRSWFLIPFIIGGIFETVGYIGRILSSSDQWDKSPYIMQTLLLLIAPALFAASIYMILGRIILLTGGEKYSLIRQTWLTKIFVSGDVLSFMLQTVGGVLMGMAESNPNNKEIGEGVIVGGLFVQLFFFGFFIIASVVFQWRGRDHLAQLPARVTWMKHLFTLYVVSGLIFVRSLFRVIEYLQGNAGYLLRHEIFLYLFDSVIMLAVMVSMNIIHPGDIAILLKEKEADSRGFLEMDEMDPQEQKEDHSRRASRRMFV
ncbi:hypothetical protein AJ80_01179 [Polytolypa hystricis UAMH7299]|uniref:RTA1 domain-containing protein n=1 Tax=Polytolypa hystricis (strain UAMH7299) TaxID=1447883 RepID=A0A2B7Z2C6_POLH7|nr:hypothetical protein AJ80_01179 [Polytolypa hystricis UAMH7299]